jgi:Holliday junction resolvase RusA-like endonuclease
MALSLLASRVAKGFGLFKGDLALEAHFYYQKHGKRKYDLDNLLKFLLDAGKDSLWEDDTQIWSISAFKVPVTRDPRTEISLQEIVEKTFGEGQIKASLKEATS